MSENRASPRTRAFLVGKIIYGGETYTLDCTIKDISETGARVKVQDLFSIPNNIVFLDPKNFSAYESTVKWRKGTEMGLSFDEPISLQDESNPRVKSCGASACRQGQVREITHSVLSKQFI